MRFSAVNMREEVRILEFELKSNHISTNTNVTNMHNKLCLLIFHLWSYILSCKIVLDAYKWCLKPFKMNVI